MANTGRHVTMQLKERVSAGHTLEREWSMEDFALEGQGQHRLLRERVSAGFTQEVLVCSSNPVSKVDFGKVLALEQPSIGQVACKVVLFLILKQMCHTQV